MGGRGEKTKVLRAASRLCLALVACGQPAYALDLEDAFRAAYRNSPTLLEAQLAVRSAGESRWQARAEYLPSIDLNHSVGEANNERTIGNSTFNEELGPERSSVRLTQELYTGGRRGAQMRLSRATVDGARQALALTEQGVALEVVDAYTRVRRDEAILRYREAYLTGLGAQVEGTRRRLDVGEVTITDLSLTEGRLAGARGLAAQVGGSLATSRADFERVTGVAADDLERPLPPLELPQSLDEALANARRDHPAIQQARESERAARARIGIERSALLPRVAVVAEANRQEEVTTPDEREEGDSVVAQLTMPLFEGGYSWSRVRQGGIDASRARATINEVERQVEADVIERWSALQAARQITLAAAEQVRANEVAVRGAERELGLGLRSTLDVLNTREEWQEALVAQARAEADEIFAAYALLAATGGLTFEALGVVE
jgi:outer membrane protein